MTVTRSCTKFFILFFILIKFAGERPLPSARLDELTYVLKELASMTIHSDSALVLPLHPHLISGLAVEKNPERRPHLVALFPSFCDIVVSR